MEAKAVARFVRIAPRKARLVADIVRGKKVVDAFSILELTNKKAATPVKKTIKSAAYNVINNNPEANLDIEDLIVKTIFIDEGPTMKRIMPRALGRAYRIRKRTSHITVIVGEK